VNVIYANQKVFNHLIIADLMDVNVMVMVIIKISCVDITL